jgi:1,4-dihydroxy-2-naphthoyl-CoA synthase
MSERLPTVLLEKRGDIAVVTLNRPDAVNAFSVRMRDELWEVLAAGRDDPDVRGMLLVGAGNRGFCAGADLTEFGTAPSQTIARREAAYRICLSRLAISPLQFGASGPHFPCVRYVRCFAQRINFKRLIRHIAGAIGLIVRHVAPPLLADTSPMVGDAGPGTVTMDRGVASARDCGCPKSASLIAVNLPVSGA